MSVEKDNDGRIKLPWLIGGNHKPYISMTRIVYDTGRRRPRCDARIPYYPEERHPVSGPDYGWCAEIARWKRGAQNVCDFHAGMIEAGERPDGITYDGKWGTEDPPKPKRIDMRPALERVLAAGTDPVLLKGALEQLRADWDKAMAEDA